MKNLFLQKILLLLMVALPSGYSFAWDFNATSLKNCQSGMELVASFPFQDKAFSDQHDFAVFSEGFLTLDEVVAKIKAKGFDPVAVWNGGFFGGGMAVSYYKSTVNGTEHFQNSQRGPRACTLFDHTKNTFEMKQSTTPNYKDFVKTTDTEIFCAGPQLLEGGTNVAKRQYCDEQFSPLCRSDGSDPGIAYSANYPRTASCFTANGDFKVFAYLSTFKKCGATLDYVATRMEQEGCIDGMNHDGGGSSKLYVNNGKEQFFRGYKADAKRDVPVWIAIIKKKTTP